MRTATAMLCLGVLTASFPVAAQAPDEGAPPGTAVMFGDNALLLRHELEKTLSPYRPPAAMTGIPRPQLVESTIGDPAADGPPSVANGESRSDGMPARADAHSSAARRAMVEPCDATCRWISTALAVAGIGALVSFDSENNATIGDFTRHVPWLAGLIMTRKARDKEGLKQLFWVGASSLFTTTGMKYISDKVRPDARGDRSFPSGHATAGFFGAAFISQRYGPRWGVPAWVFAAYTGATRVYAERHYVDDVVSSLSLGLMSNWLFTTPISERVAVNPALAGDRVGFTVSVATTGASRGQSTPERADQEARFRYQWEFGPATITENSGIAPIDVGDPIDFRFEEVNNPLYTARIALDWRPGGRRRDVLFRFTPFEIRDFGSFDEDTGFAGVTFPPGQDLRSRSIAYDLTATYRRRLVPAGRLDVRVGGGVTVLYTLAGLAPVNRRESVGHLDFVEARALTILPIVHLHLGYAFGRRARWSLFVEGDGMDLSADRYLDTAAQLGFRVSPRWDVGLGYRRIERRIGAHSLESAITRRQYVTSIGYRF